MLYPPVITIDGFSGVGKGTLCQRLAKMFGWQLLDSGAIYRVLALVALNNNVDITSEQLLIPLALDLNVHFIFEDGKLAIIFKNKNIIYDICTEIVGYTASLIATLPLVRKILLHKQRSFRILPGLIADGRDMGTIIFPDASVKIFLNASIETRAYRRMKQLQSKGFDVNMRKIIFDIKKRDYHDCNRIIAPLIPAKNAFIINSTNLSVQQVVEKILVYIKNKHDNLYHLINKYI